MQQDNTNMDKKLKQLENQSLPDLSKMDEHWNDLKNSLQPEASLPKSKPANKLFRWVIAASLAGVLFYVSYKFIFKSSDEIISIKNWERVSDTKPITDTSPSIKFIPGKETSTIIGKDTITLMAQNKPTKEQLIIKAKNTEGKEIELKWVAVDGSGKKNRDTVNFIPQKEKANYPPVPVILKGKTTEGKEIEVIAVPVNDTTNKTRNADKKKALQDFFAEMEKESQSFVINNKRDTVIQGNAGTALLILANTFGSNEDVTITMKEYYSYQDIVTNRLTTCSDNKLLVTGGMLHLTATANGKDVTIQPGKSIRWFVPDTTIEMKQMQLFNGIANNASLSRLSEDQDTVFVEYYSANNINWVPQSQYFSSSFLETRYKVLNVSNEPYKTRATLNGLIGKFLISDNSEISEDELKTQLKEKYGYYKVKIKGRTYSLFPRIKKITTPKGKVTVNLNTSLGDSAWLTADFINLYNLKPTDTITYMLKGGRYTNNNFFPTGSVNLNLNNLTKRLSVDIRTLGWINCDRFYDDKRPKIEFIVNLGDTASNYYTLLVFDKIKSMMTGYISGNKVAFQNVPEGEAAKIISVSIRDGKPVAAMQSVQLSRKVFEGLKFEETTAAEFKEKAGGLDKP